MKDENFYIVGIGYSAGGLTALIDFLQCLPAVPNASFVVIPHLFPSFRSQLGEIIARNCNLPVTTVSNATEVKVNQVYLLEANTELHISGNTLHTFQRSDKRFNKAIDEFLYSLADNRKNRAVAVILSGMGTDGTMGARHIHDMGGYVLVQHPDTARFESMPANVIRADNPLAISSPCHLATFLHSLIQE